MNIIPVIPVDIPVDGADWKFHHYPHTRQLQAWCGALNFSLTPEDIPILMRGIKELRKLMRIIREWEAEAADRQADKDAWEDTARRYRR